MRLCVSLSRRRRGPAGLRNAAAPASICFEGVISGGGGDRRERVPAPDRADIGVAAAQLSAEIGDSIRHDLQGVRAVPAPHGETGAFPPSSTAWSCAAGDIPFIPPCFYIHTFPGSL